jgi:predicted transcriptional regulator
MRRDAGNGVLLMNHDSTEMASLGAAESEVLNIVWELKEATVQQVWAKLPPARPIASVSVQTMLRRLRDKGYVKSRVAGKAHVFSPAIERERVISKKVGDLVDRFFGGDAVALVLHLAKSCRLDQKDIKRLLLLLEIPQRNAATQDLKEAKG